MPSLSFTKRYGVLLAKELREILRTRTFWLLWLVLTFLVGYSFLQAVRLYGEASRTALPFPDMARGLSPLDGVLVPTFGAYYVVATFLLPFLAIRSIGSEKQSGSLKLLLQMPVRAEMAVAIKALALFIPGFLVLIPGLSTFVVWKILGGHLHAPETLNLLLGHALYVGVVVSISFFAAAVTDSIPTAAVAALAFILGSWVLDFAGGSSTGFLKNLSAFSLMAALRPFEHGLFSLPHTLYLGLTNIGFLLLTVLWIPGNKLVRKIPKALLVVTILAILGFLGGHNHFSKDMSEDRRNSLNPAEERALQNLKEPLMITIHLSREDSRLKDMERNILDKLRRNVPHLKVIYAEETTGPLGVSAGEDYGWIVYEYGGKMERSTSNSDEEILPILYELSGQKVTLDSVKDYPGYPLVTNADPWEFWFYGILPALGLWGAVAAWRGGRKSL